MNNSGIYLIKNLINGKQYVGSAVNFKNRFYNHINALNQNNHDNYYLQLAWNKYGEENFELIKIEFIEDKTKLIESEQFWINYFKPEYNILKIAGSSLGYKHTNEARQKISESMKGIMSWNKGVKCSDETKKKISEAKKGKTGKHHSDEAKNKMSEAKKGKIFSNEHKKKLSEAQKGNTNLLGYKHTNETKRKMSESAKNRRGNTGHLR